MGNKVDQEKHTAELNFKLFLYYSGTAGECAKYQLATCSRQLGHHREVGLTLLMLMV